MPRNLLLDVDDVICDLAPELQRALSGHTGRDIPVSAWHRFDALTALYGVSPDRFYAICREARIIETALPCRGVAKALRAARARSEHITLCTARGWNPDAEPLTRAWMERFDLPFDDLIIVPHGQSKAACYERLGRHWDLFVDDNDHHVDEAISSPCVRRAVLRDRPWNHYRADLARPGRRFDSLAQALACELPGPSPYRELSPLAVS